VSDLKVKSGQPISAANWNNVIDRLPSDQTGPGTLGQLRIVLCRTTEAIAASTINAGDTTLTVYRTGLVQVHGLVRNSDGNYNPVITTEKRLMINVSAETIPAGAELWGMYTFDGLLISTVWPCEG
jgi:hypothetical protein